MQFLLTLADDSSIFETKESEGTGICTLSGCLYVTWIRVRKERGW